GSELQVLSSVSRSCNKAALNRVAPERGPRPQKPREPKKTHDSGGTDPRALPDYGRRVLDWQIAFAGPGGWHAWRPSPAFSPRALRAHDSHVVRTSRISRHRSVAHVPGRHHPAPGRGPSAGGSS